MHLYCLTFFLKDQAVCKSKSSLSICHSASIQENNIELVIFFSFIPSFFLSFLLTFFPVFFLVFLPSLLSLFLLSIHPRNIYCVCTCQHLVEKTMAPHSSALPWKIPWTEEPGRLQYMGLLRVGHDWAISLSLFTFMHWRRKWQPTPVFLPGESQGRGSLVGCLLWGRTELDTTEAT